MIEGSNLKLPLKDELKDSFNKKIDYILMNHVQAVRRFSSLMVIINNTRLIEQKLSKSKRSYFYSGVQYALLETVSIQIYNLLNTGVESKGYSKLYNLLPQCEVKNMLSLIYGNNKPEQDIAKSFNRLTKFRNMRAAHDDPAYIQLSESDKMLVSDLKDLLSFSAGLLELLLSENFYQDMKRVTKNGVKMTWLESQDDLIIDTDKYIQLRGAVILNEMGLLSK